MGKAKAFPICKSEVRSMKRIIPLALALLLLAACSTPAAQPTATVEASHTPSPVPVPPEIGGESPYAAYVRDELEELRGNVYRDDEDKIRDTVTMYMDLWYDRMYNPEYTDYGVFGLFFDKTAEGYPHLQYHCMEARYLVLSDVVHVYGPVVWHDYDIDIASVALDGDTAVVEIRSPFRALSYKRQFMTSGMFYFWITLGKTDGVWFLTDISPDSIYGSDRHGSYDELLESIEELEAEYERTTQAR